MANSGLILGHIGALFRYPLKSVAGEPLETATLGWHGIEGDRRLAFRRLDNRSGMPWLTASRLPELLLYTPLWHDAHGEIPTHVRTPDGTALPVFREELADDVEQRHGAPVQMMQLRHGIFDETPVSVIAVDTIHEISLLAGVNPDVRRFRPNILVRLLKPGAFQEDAWLGGTISFGEGGNAPAIAVTMRDERCAMLNIDPDTATLNPEVMKAAVRANQNNAGIYATVTCPGRLAIGQPIYLRSAII